jgi:hypothetical protein
MNRQYTFLAERTTFHDQNFNGNLMGLPFGLELGLFGSKLLGRTALQSAV